MYNCTSSYADRPEFFGEYFYILLCGAGAGFQYRTITFKTTKDPTENEASKRLHRRRLDRGWASAVDVLMSSYL